MAHPLLLLLVLLAACPGPARQPPPANTTESRVDPLIARLDEVSGSFQTLDKDPIVMALLALEHEAVEPLIEVLESDARITKLEYDREREFEPVTRVPTFRVAFWLLKRIIDTSYFTDAEMRLLRPGGRALVASDLRAEWAKWRHLPRAERWLAQLADDAAGEAVWLDAARKLFAFVPDPQEFTPFDVTRKLPLAGDPLRRKAPRVTELVERRAAIVGTSEGCELARLLGRWDAKAALPLSERLMRRAIKRSRGTHEHAHCIWTLAVVRTELGDPHALGEYATWLAAAAPPIGYWAPAVFQPLYVYVDRLEMQALATSLFTSSAWLPLVTAKFETTTHSRAQLLELPLYKLRAFRDLVRTELANRTAVGTVQYTAGGHWSMNLANGINFSTTRPQGTDGYPTHDGSHAIRMCDYYAYQAGRQTGAPAFELYWDEPRRDAAITRIAAWLQ